MNHYIRIDEHPNGANPQVWQITDKVACRIGVANPQSSPGCYFKADAGETIWDNIRKNTPWFEPAGVNPFQKCLLEPGQFYLRMARPYDQHPGEAPGRNPGVQAEYNVLAMALSQLRALTTQLENICQTVHPMDKTFGAFGHDIRNLLILASTEAETHWRGVLVANGIVKKIYSTNEYVLLRSAMRLDEYAVTFPSFPWLDPIKPFEGWDAAAPTTSLKWYDAYNAVKHNRENEFERASLTHAFEAVAACAILIAAQFGRHQGPKGRTMAESFFHFSSLPNWPITEVYIYPYGTEKWRAVPFKF